MNNNIWKQQLKDLERYVKKLDYTVEYDKYFFGNSYFDLANKKIEIHNGSKLENQFYSFLHEIGHLIISQDQKEHSLCMNFSYNNFSENSLTKKVSLIEEELLAWNCGLKTAIEQNLYVNEKNYNILRAKYVKTYIMWLASRG